MQSIKNIACYVTERHDCPPWISGSEQVLAIQTAFPLGYDSLTLDQGFEYEFMESQPDEHEPIEEEILESRLLGGAALETRRPKSCRQAPPSFSRNRDVSRTPKRLPETVAASGAPTWTISAPEIEQAVINLYGRLKRTPLDSEVAKELNLSLIRYYEALILRKDFEAEIASRNADGGNQELVWVGAGNDHAVFCCLRSGILKLFRNAVRMLPQREHLVITLRYSEELNERDVRLTLAVPESTFTGLSASASLRLKARLFGSRESDHWGGEVKPACDGRGAGNKQMGPEAHIYISGGQDGWLPSGSSWESLSSNAQYDHFAQKWFFVDDGGELNLVQRQERHQIKINEVCSSGS
jgi:hypothetical protein